MSMKVISREEEKMWHCCEIFHFILFYILDSVDCGIKLLKCCNTPRWRMLGTTKMFLTILILLGILQGISEKFFTISVHQAALEHDFDAKIIGKLQRRSCSFLFSIFFTINSCLQLFFRMAPHFEWNCARNFCNTYCVLG